MQRAQKQGKNTLLFSGTYVGLYFGRFLKQIGRIFVQIIWSYWSVNTLLKNFSLVMNLLWFGYFMNAYLIVIEKLVSLKS